MIADFAKTYDHVFLMCVCMDKKQINMIVFTEASMDLHISIPI